MLRQSIDAGLLHGQALTVSGRPFTEDVGAATNHNPEVIRPLSHPLLHSGGIAALRGNLAPSEAIIKPSAASPELMRHRGRAVVFKTMEDHHARSDDGSLYVDETSVLALKNCGPRGYRGMAEVANMGLPPRRLRRGVRDMVGISDARMSGTAYGTVTLHVSPEAAMGGPLALVKEGDVVEVEARRLHIDLPETEFAARRTAWVPLSPDPAGGYAQLHRDQGNGAHEGADFTFLRGRRGSEVKRHSH